MYSWSNILNCVLKVRSNPKINRWMCEAKSHDGWRWSVWWFVSKETRVRKGVRGEEMEERWESMKTRGVALHILMSSVLAGGPWDWSYSQVCVCVCVFDLYIYDGSLPVCLLLPCHLDSIGDQQLDEGTTEHSHNSHLEHSSSVCVFMCVCVCGCVSLW